MSGVDVSSDLRSLFNRCNRNQDTRYIKVKIEDGELVSAGTTRKDRGFARDFDTIRNELDDNEPSYFIVWKDKASKRSVFTGSSSRRSLESKEESKRSTGASKLMLAMHTPEECLVRDRMLYASSRSALWNLVGTNAEEYHGTEPGDFTFAAYSSSHAEGDDTMLTEAERARREQDAAAARDFGGVSKGMGLSLLALASDPEKMKAVAAGGDPPDPPAVVSRIPHSFGGPRGRIVGGTVRSSSKSVPDDEAPAAGTVSNLRGLWE
jgi:hypothetical protein